MKKIILIGPCGNSKKHRNGAAAKNYHLYNFFRQKKYIITVIDTTNWKSNPFILIKILLNLIFKNYTYFIFSLNSKSAYRLFQITRCFKKNNKFIYWVIGGSLADKIEEGIYNINPYKTLDKIIVEGNKMKEKLKRNGFDNVITVPNFKQIKYIPNKITKDTSTFKFVFISRIIPQKGCDLIIESAKILNNLGYKFLIDFYGPIDNNYSNIFKSKISELENLNYKGYIDLTEQTNYDCLAKYDIMLFPTYWSGEGFPGILIDAYIAGLPIIATDWNLNSDIIEINKSGWTIPPQNVNALSNSMKYAIEHRDQISSMSEYCKKSAMKYSIDNILSDKLLSDLDLIN